MRSFKLARESTNQCLTKTKVVLHRSSLQTHASGFFATDFSIPDFLSVLNTIVQGKILTVSATC